MTVLSFLRISSFVLASAATVFLINSGLAQKSVQHKITVQAKLSQDKVHAGAELRAMLLVGIQEGWHINSATPSGENSIMTTVHLKETHVAKILEVQYPPGEEKEFGFADTPLSVYEGSVRILINVGVATDLKPGTYTLSLSVGYQACDDNICLSPASVVVEVPLQVVRVTEPVQYINEELFKSDESSLRLK